MREAQTIFNGVKHYTKNARRTRVVVCPPTVFLGQLLKSYSGSKIMFGAQDSTRVSQKDGAFTGEISPTMLKRSGVEYVIIGHSERRALVETNEIVAQKVKTALSAGLFVILCVGEDERDVSGNFFRFLDSEIKNSLLGVSRAAVGKLIVAYEPIWAIGKSAKSAVTPHDLHRMSIFIKKTLSKIYGRKIGTSIPVLYGGSVEPENAQQLLEEGTISGFLVGHDSLVPKDFGEIVSIVDKHK